MIRVSIFLAFFQVVLPQKEYSNLNWSIKSYSVSDYSAHVQNWQVVQGNDGFVYIANQSRLLVYNGYKFRRILLKNIVVRSIYVDSLSRVYFGGLGSLGFIDDIHSQKPNIQYINPDSTSDAGLIRKVEPYKKHIYFGSLDKLHIYSPESNSLKTLSKAGTMRFPTNIQGKLIVYKYKGEAFEIVDHQSLKPFPHFNATNHISFQEKSQNSAKESFIISYPRTIVNLSKLPFATSTFLPKNRDFFVYNGTIDQDDNFVLATFNSGVIFADENGHITAQITEEDGLSNNNVRDVQQLTTGEYFAATNSGLSKISKTHHKELKLNNKGFGSVNKIASNKSTIFVLFEKGLSLFSKNLKLIQHINTQVPLNDILFIENDTYLLSENDILKLKQGQLTAYNLQLGDTKAVVLGETQNSIQILESNNLLQLNLRSGHVDTLQKFQVQITNVAENGRDVFFGSSAGSWKVTGSAVKQIIKDTTLHRVAIVDGSLISAKTFGLIESKSTFQQELISTFGGNVNLYEASEYEPFVFARTNGRNILFWKENRGYRLDSLSFANLPTTAVNTSYFDPIKSELWLGTQNGLFVSSIDKKRSFKKDLKLYTRAVRTDLSQKQQVVASVLPQSGPAALPLPFIQANYHFSLVSPFFGKQEELSYRTKLSGYAEQWSPWTKSTDVHFTDLFEGNYSFTAQLRDIYGNVATARPLKFTILAPWFRSIWMIGIYLLSLGGLIYLIIRRVISIQKKKAQELLEFQEAKAKAREADLRVRMEKEQLRNRIASDLHDEIGSNLSTISMLSQLLEKAKITDLKAIERLAKIKSITALSSHSMRDIVWFVNPENESFEKLISRMREVASMMLEEINYSFDTNSTKDIDLQSMDFRRNLFLFYKECLQNILKHAKASSVKISIFTENKELILIVSDNGIGFDTSEKANGNGLANYRKRASAINGDLSIESAINEGTKISLKVKLP